LKTQPGFIPVLVVSFLLSSGGPTGVVATEEIGEQEEIECLVCHADPEQSAETLTDSGLYYQYMRTLTGYEQVLDQFETCTYCHAEQAGAKNLTSEGHRFRWMMENMVGLRAWLDQYHPWSEEEENVPASR